MDKGYSSAKIIDKVLLFSALGIGSGVAFSSFYVTPSSILLIILGLGLLFFIASFFKSDKSSILFLIGLYVFAFLLGIGRYEMARPDTVSFASSVGKTVTLKGVVSSDPTEKTTSQQFTLALSRLNILVGANKDAVISYGDEVEVSGMLTEPENFLTSQGTEFDYISYLYKDDILYRMQNAHVVVVSHGHGSAVISALIPVTSKILEGFHKVMPPPESDLLGGLVLGAKGGIDNNFRNALVATGTIHIIALSGYNVSIVASALRDVLVNIPGLGAVGANAFGALGIIVFVLMTGAQSSAIRAGIMALIAILARTRGRTYDAFRALLFAGTAMVLWNPKFLVFDVSFQLSFLATLGIIFLTPIFEVKFARIPEKILWFVPLRETIAVTLGAQIAVLPFILYKMGVLSIIALPANMIVLPLIPYTMLVGSVAGILGLVSPLLALPFAKISYWMLLYLVAVITYMGELPFASITLHIFPCAAAIFLYGLLGYWVYLNKPKV